jgi:hypothetical protein
VVIDMPVETKDGVGAVAIVAGVVGGIVALAIGALALGPVAQAGLRAGGAP